MQRPGVRVPCSENLALALALAPALFLDLGLGLPAISVYDSLVLYYLPALLSLLYYNSLLAPIDGLIGHDYSHDFTRYYLGILHFKQNGLFSLPHFTPSLCGGIPYFANPQSSYFSVPQWFSFLMDPLSAARLTVVIFQALGYLVFVRTLKRHFKMGEAVAHLGALCFMLNGFLFENLFVGHLTHHAFPLSSLILFVLFRSYRRLDWAFARNACLLALFGAYLIFSGGLHVFVLMLALGALSLPLAWWKQDDSYSRKNLSLLLLLAGVLMLGSVSSKLLLASHFSETFANQPLDVSTDSAIIQFLRYFWFTPSSTPLFLPFGRLLMGVWEYVGFFTKLAIPALLFVFYQFSQERRTRSWLLGYVLLTAFFVLAATGRLNNANLPLLKNYHNPIKLLGALSPLFALAIAVALSRWQRFFSAYSKTALYGGAALLLAEFHFNTHFFTSQKVGLTSAYSAEVSERVRELPALPPVTEVIADGHAAVRPILLGQTNLKCYEPVFGYRLEALETKLTVGKTEHVENGTFNLNHPGCFLDPTFYGCQARDRIPAAENSAFQSFREGKADVWPLPTWFVWNARVNLVVILGCLILVFLSLKPVIARRA